LVKSHKYYPRPLDEGPRPKSGKSRLHGTILEGKSMGLEPPKKNLKRRAHDLKNQTTS
jgi:hypothetical protein